MRVCAWSKNGLFALEALFRGGGVPGARGGAGCLREAALWTAHGRRGAEGPAALKVKVLLVVLPGTGRHALGHHLHDGGEVGRETRLRTLGT